jgi:hypothetical protein
MPVLLEVKSQLSTVSTKSRLLYKFPDALVARLSLYSALSPSSSASELASRTWDYPIQNFIGGHGTGG